MNQNNNQNNKHNNNNNNKNETNLFELRWKNILPTLKLLTLNQLTVPSINAHRNVMNKLFFIFPIRRTLQPHQKNFIFGTLCLKKITFTHIFEKKKQNKHTENSFIKCPCPDLIKSVKSGIDTYECTSNIKIVTIKLKKNKKVKKTYIFNAQFIPICQYRCEQYVPSWFCLNHIGKLTFYVDIHMHKYDLREEHIVHIQFWKMYFSIDSISIQYILSIKKMELTCQSYPYQLNWK